MAQEVRILVTGGGTGGHVGPALAVIQELKEQAAQDGRFTPVFQYMGSELGMEARLAREAAVEFVGVRTAKFRRWSNTERFFQFLLPNVRDALSLPGNFSEAVRAVRQFRPDITFSTGGHVSVAPVIASAYLKVPVVIHEQTVTIGLANKINARFATRIALTFEGAAEDLPPGVQSRTVVTGNPVRNAVFHGNPERGVRRFRFDPAENDLFCLYITGGAQGASLINRSVEAVLEPLLSLPCRVILQCGQQPPDGEQDFDRLSLAMAPLSGELRRRIYLAQFIESDAIGDAYALADLVIGRSGAGTVTEICALGKPSLLIPKVPTGGDEQTRNAKRLSDAGAAVLLPQSECDGPRLLREIKKLLSAPDRLAAMGQLARGFARPRAAADLAALVLAQAKRRTW